MMISWDVLIFRYAKIELAPIRYLLLKVYIFLAKKLFQIFLRYYCYFLFELRNNQPMNMAIVRFKLATRAHNLIIFVREISGLFDY